MVGLHHSLVFIYYCDSTAYSSSRIIILWLVNCITIDYRIFLYKIRPMEMYILWYVLIPINIFVFRLDRWNSKKFKTFNWLHLLTTCNFETESSELFWNLKKPTLNATVKFQWTSVLHNCLLCVSCQPLFIPNNNNAA